MNQLGQRLNHDHQELATLLASLARAAEVSDREALGATWAELETRLLRHMKAEESYLLPLLEASHPAEVKRTLLEHAQLRDQLAKLGLAVELHTVRNSDIVTLIEKLDAHSKHEDERLYALAGDKASVAVEHSIVGTLKTVVRSALRAVKPHASHT